jgi:prepilin-type processing-associated H-X9-DG protein
MKVQPKQLRYDVNESHSGFTLTDLLAVLATLAILVALALPAMASTREKSPRSQCKSNLHQLWLATQLYADENRGNLPNYGSNGSWLWDLPRATAEAVTEKGARRRIMYCPDSTQSAILDSAWNFGVSRAIVGYSVLFSRSSPSIRLTPPKQLLTNINVPMTNSTLAESELIADVVISDVSDRNFDLAVLSANAPAGYYGSSHLQGQRPAGGNILFLDGHVAWRNFDQMAMWYVDPASRGHWWF